MLDHQLRRAPNASVEYGEAKAKFAINSTMKWLSSQPDQHKLIRFAVGRARSLSAIKISRQESCDKEVERRLKDTERKRDEQKHNKVEKKILELFKTTAETRIDDLREISPEAKDEVLELASRVLNEPGCLVAENVKHIWFDKDTNQNVLYEGRVNKFKITKSQPPKYTISYFCPPTECFEESVDYNIPFKQVVSDILFEDFMIVE